jgi:thioredoxin
MKSGGLIEHVSEGKWENDVVESRLPVFVEFSATWCGPCRAMAPAIESAAKEFKGKVKFVDIDVDKNHATASRFEVFSVPTFVVLVGGKTKKRFVGMATKDHIVKLLNSSIGA